MSTSINHALPACDALNTSAATSTPPANQNALSIKSIDPLSKGTYRVTFSDASAMILRADCTDGQMFIDLQGKRYLFDRRQPHQPEAIQERLALMQQDHHASLAAEPSPQHQQP